MRIVSQDPYLGGLHTSENNDHTDRRRSALPFALYPPLPRLSASSAFATLKHPGQQCCTTVEIVGAHFFLSSAMDKGDKMVEYGSHRLRVFFAARFYLYCGRKMSFFFLKHIVFG